MTFTLSSTSSCLIFLSFITSALAGICLENDAFEEFLSGSLDGPAEGSCCQEHICLIPCPVPAQDPGSGFAIAVGVGIAISFVIGMLTFFFVKGESENYFVAGRSLPLWIVSITLGAQSIDSNALLGNVNLSYKFHFWDGAVLPIGLGLSLIINGVMLAHHVNNDEVMTLPDIFAKRYGKTVEVLVSCCTIASFCALLAGNLVGMGAILSYLWGIEETGAIWLSAGIVWSYTVTGGLYSVAYTDVAQAMVGWSGCIVTAFYLIVNAEESSAPPSVGYPDYVYPDAYPDGEVCSLYQGAACNNVEGGCCYNPETQCEGVDFTDNCALDNAAYPFGDQRIFADQMTNHLALTPFPNAIYWNWATIFILAFGNLAALDFQARCMASKTARNARIGCLIGGCFTFFVGIPFAYLGAITRFHYGPDSVHAEFTADTCSDILGLPTCAKWNPDATAFLKLLTNQAPGFLGAWCMLGIVAATMSTADGAILAMGTVFSHNVVRQLDTWFPKLITDKTLLLAARVSTIPFALAATLIGAYYDSPHPAGATGYLLIVAFDVVLATVVAPLFGAFYTKNPSPRAAFLSVVSGLTLRIMLEFALPKDGFLLLPFQDAEFQDFGPAASTKAPVFWDLPTEELWNSTAEPCHSRQFEDYTGVDSLSSFFLSIIVFVSVQFLEHKLQRPLFSFPGDTPYDKLGTDGEAFAADKVVSEEEEDEELDSSTKHEGTTTDVVMKEEAIIDGASSLAFEA